MMEKEGVLTRGTSISEERMGVGIPLDYIVVDNSLLMRTCGIK